MDTDHSEEDNDLPSDWRAQLRGHSGNDDATLVAIANAFLEEVPLLVHRIEQAIRSGDTRLLRTAAHTLKSCLRYVAPDEDVSLASHVEKNAEAPNTIPESHIVRLAEVAQLWSERVKLLRDETAANLS